MITFAQVPHDPHPGISQQRSTWSCLDPLRKHRNRSLRRKHYHRPRGLRAHEAIRHGTERPTRLSVLRGQFRNHPAILRKPAGCVRVGNIQISSTLSSRAKPRDLVFTSDRSCSLHRICKDVSHVAVRVQN